MDREILINLGIICAIIFVYLIAKNWNRFDREYAKLYSEIINSDKYKVKGRN